MQPDMVNHPPHYKDNGSGIECIEVSEQMPFVLGNALKYIWRYESRGSSGQDLRKAKWYLQRALYNGHAASMPFKARALLNRVLGHEPAGLRYRLFILMFENKFDLAISAIDSELERYV
jgi:TPR repeat protein